MGVNEALSDEMGTRIEAIKAKTGDCTAPQMSTAYAISTEFDKLAGLTIQSCHLSALYRHISVKVLELCI